MLAAGLARALQASGTFDLKEPYYRQLTAAGWWSQASAELAQVSSELAQVSTVLCEQMTNATRLTKKSLNKSRVRQGTLSPRQISIRCTYFKRLDRSFHICTSSPICQFVCAECTLLTSLC